METNEKFLKEFHKVSKEALSKVESTDLYLKASNAIKVMKELFQGIYSENTLIENINAEIKKIAERSVNFDKNDNLKFDTRSLVHNVQYSPALPHIENAADVLRCSQRAIRNCLRTKKHLKCLKAFITDNTSEKRIQKEMKELFDDYSDFAWAFESTLRDFCMDYHENSWVDIYREPLGRNANTITDLMNKLILNKENIKYICDSIEKLVQYHRNYLEGFLLEFASKNEHEEQFFCERVKEILNNLSPYDKYDQVIIMMSSIIDFEYMIIHFTQDAIYDAIDDKEYGDIIINDDDDDDD